MSRPTDHNTQEECHIPIMELHSPPSYTLNNNPISSTCITINHPNTDTNPQPMSSLSNPSSLKRRKSLQVHWHPSVNQLQAAKRRRQIVSLLSILAFFSSLTLVLFHYSGCDITTGQCQQTITSPSSSSVTGSSLVQGRKQILGPNAPPSSVGIFGSEGLLMDSEVMIATGGRRYKAHARGPWSFLYGHQKSNHHRVGEEGSREDENEAYGGDASRYEDESERQEVMESSESVENEMNEFEEEDYGLGETEVSGGRSEFDFEEDDVEDLTPTTEKSLKPIPQETYVDNWNEGSDLLSDEYIELEDDYIPLPRGDDYRRRQSLNGRMDPDTKYMTYLPDSGLSNQFHGMLRAMMLAKSLCRTLILPPITVSNYYYDYNKDSDDDEDKSQQNQPWSSYFELETFKYLTGVKIVELQDLRDPNQVSVSPQEGLKCQITSGVGSLRPLDSTAKEFVKQWKFDLSLTQLRTETSELDELVSALEGQDEKLLCISNAYNIIVSEDDEWDLFGRYLYFSPKFEGAFSRVLQGLNEEGMQRQVSHQQPEQQPEGSASTTEQRSDAIASKIQHNDNNDFYDHGRINSAIIPNINKLYRDLISRSDKNKASPLHGPYISIHAKRGDHIDYCQQHFQHDLRSCLPTTQELASTLHNIILSDPSLKGLPVYVSTNEDRPEELDEFRALGWQVLNHQEMGSKKQLGVFGPMMMDQIFMAKAQLLIGVRTSAFSKVGANRVEDWYARRAVFM
ncbi:hypothetical protein BGZ80_009878 [Entomortierella chlamydospora]|uniref:GDP-fucose protein O-fucosyltransferase 2 n=1 Tax=Entomortierella chlamydospora TaxID=101097 RepID=A0A9P6MVK6_9FUNG|nr:hypothetical protein BGZ79_002137 [Entomortierella chlamydospora]KAG0015409.1 hypothetical protein BGZ80_009878 [Entomortierella chlamydospora]